ncbi:MAG: biotin carboxylase N-terminal domain-containing protein [Burkholderiaceae bacterium]
MTSFSRILVANRGEIASRIFRTCRRMGIQTVAVHSDADATARHVREADIAVPIGAAPARESYLRADTLVQVALTHGAQAIHPGYGFLSEKLELVDACERHGLVFIGPHREAIARMGSKIESKRIARAAGVPCVPGYDGDDPSDACLLDEARRIGAPLLIKASAGGGGKGMRRVDRMDDFPAQLAMARAEALAAFGDDRVLLERFIVRPRHLEVQLLGDRYGSLVHLFERECSIQRHYQKVVEEAPAAHLSGPLRERLYEAALALGRAIGYDSAGTVEFVLDADRDNEPCFLEMNTRLQVEHPVTEMTTGIDLVEQQIRVAAGERLSWTQDTIARSGWAIEARINAEVPQDGFQASFGAVTGYQEPATAGVRVDSGVDGASEVTPHYDAMLAKLIAYGGTRAVARDRLVQAVQTLRIEGVRTNQTLLADVLRHPAFDDVLCTDFMDRMWPGGWQPSGGRDAQVTAVAATGWVAHALHRSVMRSDLPSDRLAGFRLSASVGLPARTPVWVRTDAGDERVRVDVDVLGPGRLAWRCMDRQGEAVLEGATGDGALCLNLAGRSWRVRVDGDRTGLWCEGDWQERLVQTVVGASAQGDIGQASADAVCAGLPGVLSRLLVTPGQRVEAGEPVAVIEAMKLFHTLVAPRAGTVLHVGVVEGQTVPRGEVLVAFEPEAAAR